MIFPGVVVVIGIAISIAVFIRLNNRAQIELSERLADTGRQLTSVADEAINDAVDHAQATKAFLEASGPVTADGFGHFAETVQGLYGGGIAYAPKIPAGQLSTFLANTRRTSPTFQLHGDKVTTTELEVDRVYWPILYTSGLEPGFGRGFDLGSHSLVRAAIDSTLRTGSPAATRFLSVPDDPHAVEFLIVVPVGNGTDPSGLAVVTVELDDVIEAKAEDLFGPDTTFGLSQDVERFMSNVPDNDSTHWTGPIDARGQPVTLIIDNGHPVASSPAAPWLLALGIGISVLLGWVIYGRRRRKFLDMGQRSLVA